ncbi:MAG: hypothetical protein ACE15C_07245 [Phycisphaerae bacterium]
MFVARAVGSVLCVAALLAARPSAADGPAPLPLKDLHREQVAWQAQDGAKVEVKPAADGLICAMAFTKPSSPAWSAHLAVEDWTGQGTLVLDFAPGDATRLFVGLKDIYGTAVACPIDVSSAGGSVKVPLSSMYLQGLMMRYVKSIAFWTMDDRPHTVNLKGASLSVDGFSADWPRASMTLMDPDSPAGRMQFSYSKTYVTTGDEHATKGKKSFLCRTPKGKWLYTYGMVQHDWRNFKSIAFDLYWPADGQSTMRFIIRDAWVKGTGNNIEVAADFPVKSGANAIVIPLAAFKSQARFDARTQMAAPTAPIAWEYIHQFGWLPQGDAATNVFYLDNIRLEGDGKLSAELTDARKSMPAWGYDHLAKVDIPGSYGRIDIPAPGDKPSLELGAAKAKITPAIGTPMSEDRKVTGVLDDLYIRAAVFKDGDRKALLLVLDTLYFPAIPDVTAGCAQALGIDKASILYCVTHNHNAGAPYASKEFTQQIIDAAVEAAKEAQANIKPVRVGVAMSKLDVNFNRNQVLPDDKTRYYTVLEHRFLEKSMDSLPANKDLGAIVFTDAAGQVVAAIVSYSAHANMLCRVSECASADWPGWTSRLIEAKTGGICLTIPAASGNTNMREFNIDYSSTIKAGRDVAAEALAALTNPKLLKGLDIHGDGGIGVYTATPAGSPDEGKTAPRLFNIRAMRFGQVIFIDGNGELFNEYEADARKRSALPYTFFCFSTGGYFPTPEAFKVAAYGFKGRQADWGQVVTDAAVELTQAIRKGTTQPAGQARPN